MTYEEKLNLAQSIRNTNIVEASLSKEYRSYLEKVNVEERILDTSEGKTKIYYIEAKDRSNYCPVYVNIHGGGFVSGYAERDTIFSSKIATEIRGVAIDLDYKLAPENPFPTAFNEAYETVKWVFDNIEVIGGDKNKVIVGGHSAGGNLAAAVALKSNQTKDFQIKLQIIDYPPTDLVTDPAYKPNANINMISPERGRAFNALYTNDDPDITRAPFVSMNQAPIEMLKGLPEILMITAGYDNMCFEAEEYAKRLVAAGVKVTAKRFETSKHGFVIYCNGEWKEAQELIIKTIKKAI